MATAWMDSINNIVGTIGELEEIIGPYLTTSEEKQKLEEYKGQITQYEKRLKQIRQEQQSESQGLTTNQKLIGGSILAVVVLYFLTR